jgi:hypothetical protein
LTDEAWPGTLVDVAVVLASILWLTVCAVLSILPLGLLLGQLAQLTVSSSILGLDTGVWFCIMHHDLGV